MYRMKFSPLNYVALKRQFKQVPDYTPLKWSTGKKKTTKNKPHMELFYFFEC